MTRSQFQRHSVTVKPPQFATPYACSSCGVLLDAPPAQDLDAHCQECRSPLRFLNVPEEYCDLGEGD